MKLNGWYRIAISISALWLLASTAIYFIGISSYPSAATEWVPHELYTWTDDVKYTASAHIAAASEGKDFSDRFVFLRPQFKVSGLAAFSLLPAILLLMVTLSVIGAVKWIHSGFRK